MGLFNFIGRGSGKRQRPSYDAAKRIDPIEAAKALVPVPQIAHQPAGKEMGYLSTAGSRSDKPGWLRHWQPALRTMDEEVRYGWHPAAAMARDALMNSGFIAGGIEVAVAHIAGRGLFLNATPDHQALGQTEEWARNFAKRAEREWRLWSEDPQSCDARGIHTVDQMLVSGLKGWFGTGDLLAAARYKERSGSDLKTKILLLDAARLESPSLAPSRINRGIETDDDGAPIAYWIKSVRTNPTASVKWHEAERIPVRAANGRRLVIHVFDAEAGAVRGISPLTSALKIIRQTNELADATQLAAWMQTVLVGSITSDLPSKEAFQAVTDAAATGECIPQYMQGRAEWHEHSKFDLGNSGRLVHLYAGEKLDLKGVSTPSYSYEPYMKGLLREIAKGLGISYEQLTGDYGSANYSSLRQSANEAWQIVVRRREHVAAPFMQAIYELVLEELIDLGRLPMPGGIDAFRRHRAAVCRAQWIGPSRPVVDPLKEARAREVMLKAGITTYAQQISETSGGEWEESFEQRAREEARMRELGITLPAQTAQPGAPRR